MSDLLLRLAEKFEVDDDGCFAWTAGKQSSGYGYAYDGEGMVLAHRLAYEATVGKIPEGMQIDHLCRNKLCVNPDHLEVVTQKTNILRGEAPSAQNARKTHCKRGHDLSVHGFRYQRPSGRKVERRCSLCYGGVCHI